MLTLLARFLTVLNANALPSQIAAAMSLGLLVGLSPLQAPHNLVALLALLLLRLNISAFLVAFSFFSALSVVLDPLTEQLGQWVLHSQTLQPLWTQWYNNSFWRLVEFNNTLVMGSAVAALLLMLPFAVFMRVVVVQYRQRFLTMIEQLRLVKWLKSTKFWNIYVSIRRGGDALGIEVG